MTSDADLIGAIGDFRAALPGWWFSVCECSVSCDASCGPDRNWCDAELLVHRHFDEGFHADIRQPSTLAEALRDVMAQGLAAKVAPLSDGPTAQGKAADDATRNEVERRDSPPELNPGEAVK